MTIGCYDVVRLLGKGGMSEVYEAENPRLGTRHAIKLFTYEKDDPEVRRRFETEGRLLAKLSHPRIVKVTDFGTDEATGKPYFVMELSSLSSLAFTISGRGSSYLSLALCQVIEVSCSSAPSMKGGKLPGGIGRT